MTEILTGGSFAPQGVAVTEPVVMEVGATRGATPERASLRQLLGRFALLGFDAGADFDGALRLSRRCRFQGVTPRGLVDCMIAAVAWRHGAALLAHDADLARVAVVAGIELEGGSLRLPDQR